MRYQKIFITILLSLICVSAFAGKTFDVIKSRGYIKCGVSMGVPGFSTVDSKGKWHGLDVDMCKALSAAVFKNQNKVEFVPLSFPQRFAALQSGEVDVLFHTTTWTLTRDASLGLVFTGVNFYDGQGFIVPKKLGIKSAKELSGAEVCVVTGTTTELNLADYFRSNNMKFKPIVFETFNAAVDALKKGRCQVYTNDRSALSAIKSTMTKSQDFVVLPEIISKEPLGGVVRRGDDEWFTVVKWVMYAVIQADESDVNQQNVANMKTSKDPTIQRLLGVTGSMGAKLSLDKDWVFYIVSQVGNYNDMYQRNITPLGLVRNGSLNALWKNGGLMYAMPIR